MKLTHWLLKNLYRKWNVCYNALRWKIVSSIKATDRNELVHIAFWRPFSYQEAHVLVLDHCRLGLPHLRYWTHQSHYGKHLHLVPEKKNCHGIKMKQTKRQIGDLKTKQQVKEVNSALWTGLGTDLSHESSSHPPKSGSTRENEMLNSETEDRESLGHQSRDCKISWIKRTKRWLDFLRTKLEGLSMLSWAVSGLNAVAASAYEIPLEVYLQINIKQLENV